MDSELEIELFTTLEEIEREFAPQQMLMVSPKYNRLFIGQQVKMKVELVNIDLLELEQLDTFEIL